jgi:hypothetical protein
LQDIKIYVVSVEEGLYLSNPVGTL